MERVGWDGWDREVSDGRGGRMDEEGVGWEGVGWRG